MIFIVGVVFFVEDHLLGLLLLDIGRLHILWNFHVLLSETVKALDLLFRLLLYVSNLLLIRILLFFLKLQQLFLVFVELRLFVVARLFVVDLRLRIFIAILWMLLPVLAPQFPDTTVNFCVSAFLVDVFVLRFLLIFDFLHLCFYKYLWFFIYFFITTNRCNQLPISFYKNEKVEVFHNTSFTSYLEVFIIDIFVWELLDSLAWLCDSLAWLRDGVKLLECLT